jgi:hypothetical protein
MERISKSGKTGLETRMGLVEQLKLINTQRSSVVATSTSEAAVAVVVGSSNIIRRTSSSR